MRGAAVLVALLAAGCVTRTVESPNGPSPAEGETAAGPSRVECDSARVVVPRRMEAGLEVGSTDGGPPYTVVLEGMKIVTREAPPVVEVGDEDLSIVAEGGVRLTWSAGTTRIEEGPFRTVVYRNGKMLRR